MLNSSCEIVWSHGQAKLAIPGMDLGGWFWLDKAREFAWSKHLCLIG
jgi:hypothetical protein